MFNSHCPKNALTGDTSGAESKRFRNDKTLNQIKLSAAGNLEPKEVADKITLELNKTLINSPTADIERSFLTAYDVCAETIRLGGLTCEGAVI